MINKNSTKKQLLEHLKAELGIEASKSATKAELIAILRDNGELLGGVEPEVVAEPKKTPKKVVISILQEQHGVDPVPIGVNGDFIAIKRGEKVTIDYKHFRVLESAIRHMGKSRREGGVEMIEVAAYPFSVHEYIY